MRAGERYWGWFEELGDNLAHGHPGRSFTTAGIDRYWFDNAPDHPVIMKVLFGVSWRAFHRCHCTGPTRSLHPIPVPGRHVTLPLFARESTAFRFPTILMAAALVALVFRFARAWLPRAPAAAAAALTLAQPHLFFHAQIACFDLPIAVMAFAVGFAYWKSLRDPRWGVATGVLFGLSLGVKHNAWLMPFFLVAHYLWMRRGDLARAAVPAGTPGVRLDAGAGPDPVLSALAMAVGGAERPGARVRAAAPRARALQLRVPGSELQSAADDRRAQVAAGHGAVRGDGVDGSRDDPGAGGGGRGVLGPPPARRPRPTRRRNRGGRRRRARAGCARAPTSTARPVPSSCCRRWGRWPSWPSRRRRCLAA